VNDLVSAPISPWYTIPASVGLLALTFVFAPGVLLHLGVLIYPKGHARRQEFTAELYAVPYVKRPFWVASALVRCMFEGIPERSRGRRRVARADHVDQERFHEQEILRELGITTNEYQDMHKDAVQQVRRVRYMIREGEVIRNISWSFTDKEGRAWIVSPRNLRHRRSLGVVFEGLTFVRVNARETDT